MDGVRACDSACGGAGAGARRLPDCHPSQLHFCQAIKCLTRRICNGQFYGDENTLESLGLPIFPTRRMCWPGHCPGWAAPRAGAGSTEEFKNWAPRHGRGPENRLALHPWEPGLVGTEDVQINMAFQLSASQSYGLRCVVPAAGGLQPRHGTGRAREFNPPADLHHPPAIRQAHHRVS